MAELLPCPFCGGKADNYPAYNAVYKAEWIMHVTHCTSCQARVIDKDKSTSIRIWNHRVTTTPQMLGPEAD